MLQKVLDADSGPAVEWIKNKHNVDLSLISFMGGHSAERTHRGNTKFPGMTITTALINAVMKASKETPDRAAVSLKSRVTKLLKEND
jgi:hypothetical protein